MSIANDATLSKGPWADDSDEDHLFFDPVRGDSFEFQDEIPWSMSDPEPVVKPLVFTRHDRAPVDRAEDS